MAFCFVLFSQFVIPHPLLSIRLSVVLEMCRNMFSTKDGPQWQSVCAKLSVLFVLPRRVYTSCSTARIIQILQKLKSDLFYIMQPYPNYHLEMRVSVSHWLWDIWHCSTNRDRIIKCSSENCEWAAHFYY